MIKLAQKVQVLTATIRTVTWCVLMLATLIVYINLSQHSKQLQCCTQAS